MDHNPLNVSLDETVIRFDRFHHKSTFLVSTIQVGVNRYNQFFREFINFKLHFMHVVEI
jgi:hypothetical protein